MISAIVVYNDRARLEEMLLKSLAAQQAPHEVVALDNRDGRFPSAAAALNHGARAARGDVLFFVHQDVSFEGPDWLANAERQVLALPDLGIGGVAGAVPSSDEAGRLILSNITDTVPPQRAGHRALDRPEPVETVDECAFFVPRTVFASAAFDEQVCSGWHLYAVEYSLRVRAEGRVAYALPLDLYHRSGGAMVRVLGVDTYDAAYFDSLSRVIARHRSRYPSIVTTCGAWSTQRSVLFQRFPPKAYRRAFMAWLRGRVRG